MDERGGVLVQVPEGVEQLDQDAFSLGGLDGAVTKARLERSPGDELLNQYERQGVGPVVRPERRQRRLPCDDPPRRFPLERSGVLFRHVPLSRKVEI